MAALRMRNILAGGVAAAALLSSGCRENKEPKTPPPPVVKVVPATEGFMYESIEAIASVKPYEEVSLVARVDGYLIRRLFEEGGTVKKGQLLYEIEPQIYEAKVKVAAADLEKAQAGLGNANIEFERQKTLVGQDATSKRTFDNATASKLEAEAMVAEAEANLALARQDLSYTKIFAPFDGRIGFNAFSVGNLVGRSSGTLATVVTVDPVRVEFVITELDLLKPLRLRSGAEVPELRVQLLFQDGVEYEEEGKIAFWSNRVDSRTGTFLLQALFKNPNQKLVAGMFARVRIGPAEPRKAILIPLPALMADLAGDYVYVVGPGGKVARRDLKLGFRDERNVVVHSGLKPGEAVIVEGVQKVRPGSLAAPETDKAALAGIPLTAEAAQKQAGPTANPPFPDAVTEVAKPVPAPEFSVPEGNNPGSSGGGGK
ncbi:Efflux pump periplasmic linker BepF [bioreactor metagenome]|uniref:Efflux pump periplasmic linker BepF n=1 Tax=bioreactor metagenome TaxID=1076179 RepID=A0A645CU81_9ZZZZ